MASRIQSIAHRTWLDWMSADARCTPRGYSVDKGCRRAMTCSILFIAGLGCLFQCVGFFFYYIKGTANAVYQKFMYKVIYERLCDGTFKSNSIRNDKQDWEYLLLLAVKSKNFRVVHAMCRRWKRKMALPLLMYQICSSHYINVSAQEFNETAFKHATWNFIVFMTNLYVELFDDIQTGWPDWMQKSVVRPMQFLIQRVHEKQCLKYTHLS